MTTPRQAQAQSLSVGRDSGQLSNQFKSENSVKLYFLLLYFYIKFLERKKEEKKKEKRKKYIKKEKRKKKRRKKERKHLLENNRKNNLDVSQRSTEKQKTNHAQNQTKDNPKSTRQTKGIFCRFSHPCAKRDLTPLGAFRKKDGKCIVRIVPIVSRGVFAPLKRIPRNTPEIISVFHLRKPNFDGKNQQNHHRNK